MQSGTITTLKSVDAARLFTLAGAEVEDAFVSITGSGDNPTRKTIVFENVPAGEYLMNLLQQGEEVHFGIAVQFTSDAWSRSASTTQVNVNVLPVQAAVLTRVRETTIEVMSGETTAVAIAVRDSRGVAVPLTGRLLQVVIENRDGSDRVVIPDAEIAKSGNTATFTVDVAVTSSVGRKRWSLRDQAGDLVLAYGVLDVTYAPNVDP